MYDAKFINKHDHKHSDELWKCSSCLSEIETQSHVLFCPAYQPLREGLCLDSDKDLTDYLAKVIRIRQKINIVK